MTMLITLTGVETYRQLTEAREWIQLLRLDPRPRSTEADIAETISALDNAILARNGL